MTAQDMSLSIIDYAQAELLVRWIADPSFGAQWGSLVYQWPLTATQIMDRAGRPDVISLVFRQNDDVIGFIEIVLTADSECRLCRVIIGEHYRGKGMGACLLESTLNYIRQHCENITKVTLAVFERNHSARRCYEHSGFRYQDKVSYRIVADEQWTLRHMALDFPVPENSMALPVKS